MQHSQKMGKGNRGKQMTCAPPAARAAPAARNPSPEARAPQRPAEHSGDRAGNLGRESGQMCRESLDAAAPLSSSTRSTEACGAFRGRRGGFWANVQGIWANVQGIWADVQGIFGCRAVLLQQREYLLKTFYLFSTFFNTLNNGLLTTTKPPRLDLGLDVQQCPLDARLGVRLRLLQRRLGLLAGGKHFRAGREQAALGREQAGQRV